MHRDEQPTDEASAISPECVAEMEKIVDRVKRWAAGRPEIVGLSIAAHA